MDAWMGNSRNPKTLHRYAYGNGDPVNSVDPSGKFGLAEFSVVMEIRSVMAEMQIQGGISALDILGISGPAADTVRTVAKVTAYATGAYALLRLAGPSFAKFIKACRGTKKCDWEVPVRINWKQQKKHLPETAIDPKRSTLTYPDPEYLLTRAGTGQRVQGEFGKAGYRERIDFQTVIGTYRSEDGSIVAETTKAIIHYGSDGAHIIPARP